MQFEVVRARTESQVVEKLRKFMFENFTNQFWFFNLVIKSIAFRKAFAMLNCFRRCLGIWKIRMIDWPIARF